METRHKEYKNDINFNRPLTHEWLETFLFNWIQEDNKMSIPSRKEMQDYILDEPLDRYSWKKALWTCAAFLNRFNCPEDDPMFTRVKNVFVTLLTSSSIKFLPHDIAELEVIRNHLSLHLNHPTLEEMRDTLKNAYNTSKSYAGKNLNSSHPSWESLVANVTSKTSFEHIYPPRTSNTNKESLFWVDGKPVQIPPHPPCTCHKVEAPRPQKQRHTEDENVIEIKSYSQVREGFKIFVGHFFGHMDNPEMTPRLMRSMILITIDLLDVTLVHKITRINDLFGSVGCGKNMVEPKIFSRGLFLLWVWAGVMSNPVHEVGNQEVKSITRIMSKVLHISKESETSPEKREEVLAVIERIKRNAVEYLEREDFHSFLAMFAKYYPRQGRKEGQRGPPINELEYVFLNIRLQFGNSCPFFFHSYFLKRLCATSSRYCSRGYDYLSGNARIKEMDACVICDSSSEEEEEGEVTDDDDCRITN